MPDRCDHREDALSDPDRDTVEDPPTLLFCHVSRDVYFISLVLVRSEVRALTGHECAGHAVT
ncbi:hypothetical protein CG719_05785 [Streptomyces sp. CB01373]|nr:hypothetical protein CG719_05785 [Streptomyces sp. CB01373]